MPRIRLTESELYARGSQVRELLTPILGTTRVAGPPYELVHSGDSIVIAARGSKTGTSYVDWRVRTFVPNHVANYFEVWQPIDLEKQDEWFLYRAYLTIFKIDRRLIKETELLSLHCDPEEEDSDSGKAVYKRGPHIHIKTANHPIPKAHLALAHEFIDRVLASEKDLFAAMRLGIELISDEVLYRL